MDEILTLKEVAAFLKVAEKTVYALAQRGELPGFKIGSQWRFRQAMLQHWMDAQSVYLPTSDKNGDHEVTSAPGAIITLDRTRTRPSPASSLRVTLAGRYDLDEQRYQLRDSGVSVPIEPKAFDLLVYLVRHRNRVVSKAELLDHLWPRQVVTESSLTQCVAKVRKALCANSFDSLPIRNVYGRGYQFILPVINSAQEARKKHRQLHRLPHQFLSSHPHASACFLQGGEYLFQFTPQALAQARQMYERAITLDPQYAAAYAAAAWTYWFEWLWLWNPEPQTLDHAQHLARHAVTLNESLALARLTLGYTSLFRREYSKAIAEAEQSLRLDPHYAWAYALLGDMRVSIGQPRKALPLIEKAIQLEPQSAAHFSASLGLAYHALHRYDDAFAAVKETLTLTPNFLSARIFLTVLYSETGQTKEAKRELHALRQLVPSLSADRLRQRFPYQDIAESDRIITALQSVGLN